MAGADQSGTALDLQGPISGQGLCLHQGGGMRSSYILSSKIGFLRSTLYFVSKQQGDRQHDWALTYKAIYLTMQQQEAKWTRGRQICCSEGLCLPSALACRIKAWEMYPCESTARMAVIPKSRWKFRLSWRQETSCCLFLTKTIRKKAHLNHVWLQILAKKKTKFLVYVFWSQKGRRGGGKHLVFH